ncbi:hypothetical protein D3C71_1908160 [compost metagenome]
MVVGTGLSQRQGAAVLCTLAAPEVQFVAGRQRCGGASAGHIRLPAQARLAVGAQRGAHYGQQRGAHAACSGIGLLHTGHGGRQVRAVRVGGLDELVQLGIAQVVPSGGWGNAARRG